LSYLLALAARGASVKATGFGRLDFDPGNALAAIHRENPDALLFGTDLPSTRAPRPFVLTDLDLIAAALDDAAALRRVLHRNALALYRPESDAPALPRS
ncbi:MAG: 2-pyrone-4,6-dicarboxylate hydrolase, partial [Chromatiaceae bacterium]|nr:2-pyrone-4,6-dicarboxylate hydrolase [Chromatiaceae bacterium]